MMKSAQESPEVLASYSFAARTSFLFIETTDQEPVSAITSTLSVLKARTGFRTYRMSEVVKIGPVEAHRGYSPLLLVGQR